MLQDQNVLTNIWPDVSSEHHEMFGFLNVEFDLHESKVTIETAAKSFTGTAIKTKEYSVKGNLNIETMPREISKQLPLDLEIPKPILDTSVTPSA